MTSESIDSVVAPENLEEGLKLQLGNLTKLSRGVDCKIVLFAVHVNGSDIPVKQFFGPECSRSEVIINVAITLRVVEP